MKDRGEPIANVGHRLLFCFFPPGQVAHGNAFLALVLEGDLTTQNGGFWLPVAATPA